MVIIGEKIYKLRKKAGISQEELSYELNVSRQAVSKWENGVMQPTTDNVLMLCNYFKVNFDFFLNENVTIESNNEPCNSVNNNEIAATDIVVNQIEKPKKNYIALWLTAFVFISVLVITSIIFGSIFLYLHLKMHNGVEAIKTVDYNVLGIVFFILAFILIVSLVVIIIYFKTKKKSKL